MIQKGYRTISLIEVDENLTKIFTAYFQLLKSQLEDNWVINKKNSNSDVILINQDFDGKVSKFTKVKIILCKEPINISKSGYVKKVSLFCLTYPLNSSQIITLLNRISRTKLFLNYEDTYDRRSIFDNFIPKIVSKISNLLIKKPKSVSTLKQLSIKDKLFIEKNIDASKLVKIVLLGRPGSGKTTAINSINEKTMLNSEVTATDSVAVLKQHTTIGIDFNECIVNGDIKLQLYGTPGQNRYDYVQKQTIINASIYLILIDLSSNRPYSEFIYYKSLIEEYGNLDALNVVVFTHYDIKKNSMRQLSKEIKRKCNYEVLTERIDVRDQFQVKKLLTKLVRLISKSNMDNYIN